MGGAALEAEVLRLRCARREGHRPIEACAMLKIRRGIAYLHREISGQLLRATKKRDRGVRIGRAVDLCLFWAPKPAILGSCAKRSISNFAKNEGFLRHLRRIPVPVAAGCRSCRQQDCFQPRLGLENRGALDPASRQLLRLYVSCKSGQQAVSRADSIAFRCVGRGLSGRLLRREQLHRLAMVP